MIVYTIFCALLAVLFGGAYYAYRICFYAKAKGHEKLPTISGAQYDPYREQIHTLLHTLQNTPCEYVTIQSNDGLTLSGRYYHVNDGAPLDIGFHGYRSSAITDFCGGIEISFQLGHNVLLIDQRAHGKSEGRTITFGIKERHDLLCWIRYAIERFGADLSIVLYGISMGGATVLMASGLNLPKNVKCIIADCPYASPKDIILTVGKGLGYPTSLIWPFVILGAKIYGGFRIREITATDAVREAKCPILIIHGEADNLVPCDMSNAIAASNPHMVSRATFPNAEHGISYLTDRDRYQAIVKAFIEKVL